MIESFQTFLSLVDKLNFVLAINFFQQVEMRFLLLEVLRKGSENGVQVIIREVRVALNSK